MITKEMRKAIGWLMVIIPACVASVYVLFSVIALLYEQGIAAISIGVFVWFTLSAYLIFKR